MKTSDDNLSNKNNDFYNSSCTSLINLEVFRSSLRFLFVFFTYLHFGKIECVQDKFCSLSSPVERSSESVSIKEHIRQRISHTHTSSIIFLCIITIRTIRTKIVTLTIFNTHTKKSHHNLVSRCVIVHLEYYVTV